MTRSIPKGKLFALVAVFAAIGLVTATGAFTTATAQRTANVGVAGDSSALLRIDAVSGSSNSGSATPVAGSNPYFEQTSGTSQINLEELNLEAQTSVERLFLIQNQGTQTVTVHITDSDGTDNAQGNPSAIAFAVRPSANNLEYGSTANSPGTDVTGGSIVVGNNNNNPVSIEGPGSQVALDPGEKITVGVYIDTSDADPKDGLDPSESGVGQSNDIIDSMTIHANAGGTADYQVDADSGN